MTVDDRIRNEKLLYDISSATPKMSALSSGKIDEYGQLAG